MQISTRTMGSITICTSKRWMFSPPLWNWMSGPTHAPSSRSEPTRCDCSDMLLVAIILLEEVVYNVCFGKSLSLPRWLSAPPQRKLKNDRCACETLKMDAPLLVVTTTKLTAPAIQSTINPNKDCHGELLEIFMMVFESQLRCPNPNSKIWKL